MHVYGMRRCRSASVNTLSFLRPVILYMTGGKQTHLQWCLSWRDGRLLRARPVQAPPGWLHLLFQQGLQNNSRQFQCVCTHPSRCFRAISQKNQMAWPTSPAGRSLLLDLIPQVPPARAATGQTFIHTFYAARNI